jgi:phosphoglycolate phosphatase
MTVVASHQLSNLQTILFDLDGTIADSKPGIYASVEYLLRELGHQTDPAYDLRFILGPPAEEWIEKVLGHYGDNRFTEGVALYRKHQNEGGVLISSIYPQIPELIAGLRQHGVELFVATAKRTEVARHKLAHFGVDGLFTRIHGSTPDGRRNDKAVLIQEVLELERLDPDKTAMLGDRLYDMRGARRNGLMALGALWGYGSEQELVENGANRCFATPKDLLSAFAASSKD